MVFGEAADANLRGLKGSLIFIFDSAEIPLRYVAVSRRYIEQTKALEAHESSLAKFGVLGEPTERQGAPDLRPDISPFPRYTAVKVTWTFADMRHSIQTMNFGAPKGIEVREVSEVPWPIVVDVD